MGSHSGSGSVWDVVSPDVDQPHGNAYLEIQDLRTGVGVRLAKEHVAPADSTVGGEHIPGGCAVLALADDTDDIDTGAQTDATYIGGGLVYDQTRNILLCWSNDGTQTAAADTYDLKWSALSICRGDDFTWSGEHHFDGTVDFDCTAVVFNGDVSIVEHLACGSDVEVAGDFSLTGDMAMEGTANFYDEVDISTLNVSDDMIVDGTAVFTTAVDVSGNLDVSGALRATDPSGTGFAAAWATFHTDGANGAACTLKRAYNVNQVFKIAAGRYDVSFTNALDNTAYCVIAARSLPGSDDNFITCYSTTATEFHVAISDDSVNYGDCSICWVVVFS